MESRYDIDIDARLFFLKNETQKKIILCQGWESIRRPVAHESSALPIAPTRATELAADFYWF